MLHSNLQAHMFFAHYSYIIALCSKLVKLSPTPMRSRSSLVCALSDTSSDPLEENQLGVLLRGCASLKNSAARAG
eukprot:scaffold534674_cov18-Prasinocladus_malaysianus.AAC.2